MGKSRTDAVRLLRNEDEIVTHEVIRCFGDDGRIRFDPSGKERRFDALVAEVMSQISRPMRIAPAQWREQVLLCLKALSEWGILRFGQRGNVAWLCARRIKAAYTVAKDRRTHSREGRRVYANVNRTGYRPAFAH